MTDQIKRGIEDELNRLLQGKGLVDRKTTGEVKLLRALKLGGQEGGNWLENNVPWKVWRIKTKATQYSFFKADIITAHEGVIHPRLGSKDKNPLIHRLE